MSFKFEPITIKDESTWFLWGEQKTKIIHILEPSYQSLLIELFFNEQKISNGTGFIVKTNISSYALITNRHNVTGRDNNTGSLLSKKTGAIPNKVKIYHNKAGELGKFVGLTQPLYENIEEQILPLWIEHPSYGEKVDVVALPLEKNKNVSYFPYDLNDTDILLSPTEQVSVVGFPFGEKCGDGFAIWATGFIASEPECDFKNMPLFLIDCRTREGQSGSPVIAHRNNIAHKKNGSVNFGCHITELIGVYSGRIRDGSDLGYVWKLDVVKDIINNTGTEEPPGILWKR